MTSTSTIQRRTGAVTTSCSPTAGLSRRPMRPATLSPPPRLPMTSTMIAPSTPPTPSLPPIATRPSRLNTAATPVPSPDPRPLHPVREISEEVSMGPGRTLVMGSLLLGLTGPGMVSPSMDRKGPDLNTDLGMAARVSMSRNPDPDTDGRASMNRLNRDTDLGMGGKASTSSHPHRNTVVRVSTSSHPNRNMDLDMGGRVSTSSLPNRNTDLDMGGRVSTSSHPHRNTDLDTGGRVSTSSHPNRNTGLGTGGRASMSSHPHRNMDPVMAGRPIMRLPNRNTDLGMCGSPSMRRPHQGMDPDTGGSRVMGRKRVVVVTGMEGGVRGLNTRVLSMRGRVMGTSRLGGRVMGGPRRRAMRGVMMMMVVARGASMDTVKRVKRAMSARNTEMMALMMMRRSANVMGITTTARAMMMSNWNGMRLLCEWDSCHNLILNKGLRHDFLRVFFLKWYCTGTSLECSILVMFGFVISEYTSVCAFT